MSISQNFPALKPSLLLDFANTKKLDSRVTFARASEARYYGQEVAKAEENLILQSQTFDVTTNGWTKSQVTITANDTAAPDGTTTADKMVEGSGTVLPLIYPVIGTLPSGVFVHSVYAKQDERSEVTLSFNNVATNGKCVFDLSAGTYTLTTGARVASASIVDAGGGWYRCVIVSVDISGLLPLIVVGDGTSYTGDGASGLHLWGAQLEQRSSVTDYTPTTTQPITNYIPVLQTAANNVARFDHDPVTGESLGLLVEEQRTNLLTYSEDFANAVWLNVRSTNIANTVVAPDGTLTGFKLVEDTSTNDHWIANYGAATITSGSVYTFSAYVKAAERGYVSLIGDISSSRLGNGVYFSLADGSVITNTSSLVTNSESVGNGWWRFSITATASGSGSAYSGLSIGKNGSASTNGRESYTGDGYSGIYIWGAQLEAGAFPTSYIPTVASQVTRSADSASMTGANFSDWYRADSSTFYYDFADGNVSSHSGSAPYDTLIGAVTNGNRGGSQNSLMFSSGWQVRSRFTPDRSATIINTGGSVTTTISSTLKIATFLDQTAMGGSGNGGAVVTTPFTVPPSYPPNMLYINERLNGHIRKLAYYPARLTNEQLQALTS